MNDFIKEILGTALDQFERIYIHCVPRSDVFIGARGFVGNEKKDGIMLSFSEISCRNIKMDEDGISAELRFAGKWEAVFLPFEAIDAILDDLQEPNFVFNFTTMDSEQAPKVEKIPEKSHNKTQQTAEILKPDFTRNKKS